jgi:hypothetical protein
MSAAPFDLYVVAGIGVRRARAVEGRPTRVRDGVQQIKLELLKSRKIRGQRVAHVTAPQWVNCRLVFRDGDEAYDLYRRARNHARVIGRTIWAAAIDLTRGGAGLSS